MNIVSFGGGTNSTAMLIEMARSGIPVDLILFADTGGERPETYEFINIFNVWLSDHGMPTITPVKYFNRHGERLTLEEECLRSKTLPSIAYGFKKCSMKHKIGTQDKYCNNHQQCREIWKSGERINKFIGYDAGETRRVAHAALNDETDKKYKKHYLLVEKGWTRQDCVNVIIKAGLTLPGKSSCFFCPSMKKKEIQELWEKHPDLFQRAVEMEHNAQERLRNIKGLGRHWSWEDYQQAFFKAKEAAEMQMTLFDFTDSPGGCICGAPCGCYDG